MAEDLSNAPGLRRCGFDREARQVLGGMVEAAMQFPESRLPELFSGFGRKEYNVPVHYPVACHPQTRSAGSFPSMLTKRLGIEPEAFSGRLRIRRPILPDYVDRIQIRGMRVGEARVDVNIERISAEKSSVNVTDLEGELDVVVGDDQGSDSD